MTQEEIKTNLQNVQPITVKEYANQMAPSKIGGIHIFLMVVMMFLGFSLGQITGLENYKNLITKKIESDVYSTLEFASLNSMAAEDFKDIELKLNSIKSLSKDEKVQAELNLLAKKVENSKKIYSLRRESFKEELKNASQHKKLLYNSIDSQIKESKELKVSLAELYLLRLMELISKNESKKMADFTADENELIARVVSNIISLSPGHEKTIRRLFPEVAEKFIIKEDK